MRTIRVAAHVHSEWSYDATWSLKSLADAFAARKYDAVLMAEHDRGFDASGWEEYKQRCAEASDDRVLLVPGIEYEDPDNIVHIPVWGEGMPFLGAARPTLEVLLAARAQEGFAVFAHPTRRDAALRYRAEWTPLLGGVEVWNRHYDGVAPSPAGLRLAQEHTLTAFASLDFHTRRQFFPLAMSIDVDQPLSTSAVFDALRTGRFRADLFGIPADRFARGVPAATVRGLELSRRALRGPVRRIERALRRG